MNAILYVFIGGGLGSVCRYGIGQIFNDTQNGFPLKTFLANIISCLILGFLLGYFLKNTLDNQLKLFLMTGFCGGFSTFSTFSAEVFKLIEMQQTGIALLYVLGSVALGTLVLFCGYLAGQGIS